MFLPVAQESRGRHDVAPESRPSPSAFPAWLVERSGCARPTPWSLAAGMDGPAGLWRDGARGARSLLCDGSPEARVSLEKLITAVPAPEDNPARREAGGGRRA